MNHYVYMLWSIKKNKVKTYIGYTIDLKKRLDKHNSGKGAKSTRGRLWKIVFKKKYQNKSSALKAEYFLKNNLNFRKHIKKKINKTLCI